MSEFDFIDWLKQQSKPDGRIVVPIGDDLGAMKWGEDLLLVGADQVLDGVHFDSAVHSPRQIGTKAMNRNLSDCAAMACLPAAAVCTVALASGSGEDYARELYRGMSEAGAAFDCPIIGGDTASWPGKLVVTVTILGRSAGVRPVTRGGAKPGDHLYVTGPLGGSGVRDRHMNFTPRIALARELATTGRITAMIDLSDGLSRDLPHIAAASQVAAVIEAATIPICEVAGSLDHALHDGEDYELLFTASGDGKIAGAIRIGRIVEGAGVWIERDGRRQRLEARGWEHAL